MMSMGVACAIGAVLFIIEGFVTKYCCKPDDDEAQDDTFSNA
jgi:hypothetical protein